MYQNPTVTVLMSAHNSASFILEAVESILKQTWINFEFIIIDDGSSDNSVDLIRSFSDKRIKLICNDKNIGLTASLNILPKASILPVWILMILQSQIVYLAKSIF
jgi:glycosyltransferase involved in cell wall biosynthesis